MGQRRDYAGSSNDVLYFGNETEVISKLWTSFDGQLIHINRQAYYPFVASVSNPNNVPLNYERDVWLVAPRLGLRYDHNQDTQFFVNASRTIEPADSWKYNAIRSSSALPQRVSGWSDLREQRASTVELGTRSKIGIFEGGVTVYKSWIKNELLTAQDPLAAAGTTINFNATPTYHQGVEVGLNTTLWQEDGPPGKESGAKANPHRILFRQAYTLNDFGYENDPSKKENELPGLPRQFYQGELSYDHPSGFFAAINTQISTAYFVDYDNKLEAPGYIIYGAKLGFSAPKGNWEVFLDFRNLFDEHYVTAVSPVFNAVATTAAFQPGDGRSVFAAVGVKF